jgi:hypothetical protein
MVYCLHALLLSGWTQQTAASANSSTVGSPYLLSLMLRVRAWTAADLRQAIWAYMHTADDRRRDIQGVMWMLPLLL